MIPALLLLLAGMAQAVLPDTPDVRISSVPSTVKFWIICTDLTGAQVSCASGGAGGGGNTGVYSVTPTTGAWTITLSTWGTTAAPFVVVSTWTQIQASTVAVVGMSGGDIAKETGGNLASLVAKDFAKESGGNLATLAAKDFATGGKQDTGNSSLATIAGKDFATSANQALQATAANQTPGNSSLSSIDGKIPASPATAGAQATGNASLSSIDGKLASGQWGLKVDASMQPLNIGAFGGVSFSTGPEGNFPAPTNDFKMRQIAEYQLFTLKEINDKLLEIMDTLGRGLGRNQTYTENR